MQRAVALQAVTVTPAARRWLAASRPARVLNVFERACNLVNADGDLLGLVTTQRGLTPFGLLAAGPTPAPFRGVTAGSRVRVEPGHLAIGPVSIALAGAELWDPMPDWPAIRALFATQPDCLDQLATMALAQGKAGSLLEIFGGPNPPALRMGTADCPAPFGLRGAREHSADDVGFNAPLPAGEGLGVRASVTAAARHWAGRGGGLTPAGDDYLVGAMLAAWAGLCGPGARQLCAVISATAAPLTTTLSAAYLWAAARGECSVLWHALFDALLRASAERAAALRLALAALLAVGHTSGADALAGFLAAAGWRAQPDLERRNDQCAH